MAHICPKSSFRLFVVKEGGLVSCPTSELRDTQRKKRGRETERESERESESESKQERQIQTEREREREKKSIKHMGVS